MPGWPSVTLPKAPDGWVYDVTLNGPGGRSVKVTSTGDGCRITTSEVDGAATAADLTEALRTAVGVAKMIASTEKARALAEEGEKALESLLPANPQAPGVSATVGSGVTVGAPGNDKDPG